MRLLCLGFVREGDFKSLGIREFGRFLGEEFRSLGVWEFRQ